MKKTLILIALLFLTACSSPEETPQPSVTHAPTGTHSPTETLLPSPTPTLIPYLLEDGVLLDLDEGSGEYVVVGEEIDSLITMAEEEIVALDNDGSPQLVYIEDSWVEIKIPEGADNHEQMDVPDKWVTVVTEDQKTEEVLESGTKVLVNPETGVYEYELITGQWVEYTPRVMVVGERTESIVINIPVDVIETAAETVRNAIMFTWEVDGEMVEIETGYNEEYAHVWAEEESDDGSSVGLPWFGVLCGSTKKWINGWKVFGFMGVEMTSGDIMMIAMDFSGGVSMKTSNALVFVDGVLPKNRSMSEFVTVGRWDEYEDKLLMDEAVLNAPKGTPMLIYSVFDNSESANFNAEEGKVGEALKNREFAGSDGLSWWYPVIFGADDIFFIQTDQ